MLQEGTERDGGLAKKLEVGVPGLVQFQGKPLGGKIPQEEMMSLKHFVDVDGDDPIQKKKMYTQVISIQIMMEVIHL